MTILGSLEKTYEPSTIENNTYAHWEKAGYFKPSGEGEPYCIMLPPPNVTGSLHMGHGFGSTLMDILIRYHRLCGRNTLWQPGTDHAGIATQMVVERQLNQQGKTRHDLGREQFLKKVWEWKEESGGTITKQFRRLGASLDWSRECFTMDDERSEAVRDVFIKLYNDGLIYRGKRLVNWDPVLLTAISDLEVLNEEENGHMWHIRYPLASGEGHLIVATTRPETLLGDVAVAVHPDDERYRHLIGQHVKLPLTDREIPIIADEYVDPLFGTGCVKITPAHDFNDYAVGQRHQLDPINIFTPTAHLNENTPAIYQGLERFVARKKIVADLTTLDLIEKIEPHKLKVPRGDRTGSVIEPYLTFQWYVKCKPLAEPAIAAVKNGDVKFIPENWDKTYFQWMNNIEDWCISRQLWWGHRIPVWYDDAGNAYVGRDETEVRAQHQLSNDLVLTQDEDVLDTWFSSALWPFSTLGFPKQTLDLSTFFPTQVLVTGFDIIFFWVARMIMMSLYFMKQVPFKEVYITGLIRDADGHKMSKSKGNVLDPIDLIDGISLDALVKKRTTGLMQPGMAEKIEKNTRKDFPEGIPSSGTDALRFTFCAMASYTREIRFDMNRLAGFRNFCNKLWNASRYVIMNTEGHNCSAGGQLSLADQWIWSRLQQTIADTHQAMQEYRFDYVAQALYDFTWNEFCDWYLELSKPILTSPDSSAALLRGTRYTLINVLENLLRLLHPIMPFVTETLWVKIAAIAGISNESIMLTRYPEFDAGLVNAKSDATIEWLKRFVGSVRALRSEMNIAPGKQLHALLKNCNATDYDQVKALEPLLKTLTKISDFTWLENNAAPPPSATALAGDLEILVPLSDFIDPAEEAARLQKEMAKCEKDLTLLTSKLSNPQFVERAPADVIAKDRARIEELQSALGKIKSQLETIKALNPKRSLYP
jgi:valyl-tRNA synthetase